MLVSPSAVFPIFSLGKGGWVRGCRPHLATGLGTRFWEQGSQKSLGLSWL